MDADPYRPPAHGVPPETPELWTIYSGCLLVRDGASLPDVCILGDHTGDAGRRVSRDWFVARKTTMHTPIRFRGPQRVRITACESSRGAVKFALRSAITILRAQATFLVPMLAIFGLWWWLDGAVPGWPVLVGFAVFISLWPWLFWNRRFLHDAGNGWYQIGASPETIERLLAFKPEETSAAADDSTA